MKHFFVFRLLIWGQKWVVGDQNDNLLVAHRVSPGRIIVVLFWTRYAIPRQNKPGILKLSIRTGLNNFSIALFLLAAKKMAITWCRFGGTAQFWLPPVLQVQRRARRVQSRGRGTNRGRSGDAGVHRGACRYFIYAAVPWYQLLVSRSDWLKRWLNLLNAWKRVIASTCTLRKAAML